MPHWSSCFLYFISVLASREGTTCSFADPAFVVYSSVASFYVPFIVTLLVYAQICVVLRKRGRRTAPPRRHGLLTQSAAEAGEGHRHRKVESIMVYVLLYRDLCQIISLCLFLFQNKCTQPEDVKLCTLILRPATAGPQRKKVVSAWTIILQFSCYLLTLQRCRLGRVHKHPHLCLSPNTCLPHHRPSRLSVCQTLVKEAVVHPLEVGGPGQFLPQTEQSLAPPPPPAPQNSSHSGQARISLSISVGPTPVLPSTVTRSALMPRPPTLEDGMRGREGWRERSSGREKWGISKERVRGRLSQQKERKATQMLAIVLGKRELYVV